MININFAKDQIIDSNNVVQEENDPLSIVQSNQKKEQEAEDSISLMNQRTYDCNEEESVQTTSSKDKMQWKNEKCTKEEKQENENIQYNDDDDGVDDDDNRREGDNSTFEDIDMLKHIEAKSLKLNNMELKQNEPIFESDNSVIIMIEKKLPSESQMQDHEITSTTIPLDHSKTNVKKTIRELTNKIENRNQKTIDIIDMGHLVKLDSILYEMNVLKKKDTEPLDIIVHKNQEEVELTRVEENITEVDKGNQENKELNFLNNEAETNVGCDAKSIHTENYILYDEEDVFNDNESYDRLFLDQSINLKDTNESVEIEEPEDIIRNKEIKNIASTSKIEFYHLGTNTDQSLSVSSSVKEMYINNYERFTKKEEEEEMSNISIISEEPVMSDNPNYQVIHHIPTEMNSEMNQIFTNSQETSLMNKDYTIQKHAFTNNKTGLEIKKKEAMNIFPMNEETIIHYYKSGTIFPFKKRYTNFTQVELKNIAHANGGRIFSFDIFIDEPNKNKLAKCYIKYVANEDVTEIPKESKANNIFYYNINLETMEEINKNYKKIKEDRSINNQQYHVPKYYKSNRSQSLEINNTPNIISSKDLMNQESSIEDGCSSIIEIEAAKHIQGNNNFKIKETTTRRRRRILSESSLTKGRGPNCVCTKLNHMFEKIKNKLCFPFHKVNYVEYFKDDEMIHTGRYNNYNANTLLVPHKSEYKESQYSSMIEPNKELPINIDNKNGPNEISNKGNTTTPNINKKIYNSEYNDTHMNEKNHSYFNESKNNNVYETTDYVMLDTMNNTNTNMENRSTNVTNIIPQDIISYNYMYNQNARNNSHLVNIKSTNVSKTDSNSNFPQSYNHIIKTYRKNTNKNLKSEYNKSTGYTYPLNKRNCTDNIYVYYDKNASEFLKEKEIKQLHHPMEEKVLSFHESSEMMNPLNIYKTNHNGPNMNNSRKPNLQKNQMTPSGNSGTSEKLLEKKLENSKRFYYNSREMKYTNGNQDYTNNTNMLKSKNNKDRNVYDPENIQYYYSYSAINENLKKTSSEKYNNIYSIHENLYKNDMSDDKTNIIWTSSDYNRNDVTKNTYFGKANIQKEYSQKDFIFKKVSHENTYRNRSNTNIFFNSCCSTNVSTRDRSMCANTKANIKNHTMENLDRININY